MLAEGQLSTKGELQKQGGQQSAPAASMACTQYLLLTLGRAEDLNVMLLRTVTQEDSWDLTHAAPVEGGEEVPELHAAEAVEELTSLKKVEMECYLGVCLILLVHSQPKLLF